jgi:hypothetical protein
MIGPIIGWYARKLYDRYKKSKEPPASGPQGARDGVEPFVSFEGRVTMNQLSAPALTGEWEMGKYDHEAGLYELKEPEEKVTNEPTRLTTFIDDEEGEQQITVRWEKGRGKLKLVKARKDEIWRVEFYKVADVKEVMAPTVAGGAPGERNPFGGDPGGGVS